MTAGVAGAPLGVWAVPDLRELAGLPSPLPGEINRLRFLDRDTLLAWSGYWVRQDAVVSWRTM
jgi:hypothetical protein